ncbi:hypothetical protein DERP_003769 [Dermatophagoides pteronyssinus]|uniref:Uncharacterized protein n=1 Tax=Dermatophagoides pteronyssinus TaxID=6956 RepID=A0ABQ8JMA3_DERPT|nr:hypothetical protein DERP_003769 [Dermatophagoides pteronyssinus]
MKICIKNFWWTIHWCCMTIHLPKDENEIKNLPQNKTLLHLPTMIVALVSNYDPSKEPKRTNKDKLNKNQIENR